MTLKALFYLPNSMSGLLAAISTIQAYVKFHKQAAERGHVNLDIQITVGVCDTVSKRAVMPFIGALGEVNVIAVGVASDVERGVYDLVFHFNEQLAYKISYPNKRHMVHVFGLQLGIDPKILPDLSMLKLDSVGDKDVLFLDDTNMDVVSEGSGLNFTKCISTDPDVVTPLLSQHRMIVGTRSGYTYLACCMGKKVLEIYPPDCHRNWLSKWPHTQYAMIYQFAPKPELVASSIQALWERGNV